MLKTVTCHIKHKQTQEIFWFFFSLIRGIFSKKLVKDIINKTTNYITIVTKTLCHILNKVNSLFKGNFVAI